MNVFANGAVRLGDNIICDGFIDGYAFRVQTHIHDDHMSNFDRSKGVQDIMLSPATLDLLIAERNADLEWRDNLHRIASEEIKELSDGSKLSMPSSNHMLGACQVAVELPDGRRIGYSGDFGWPIENIIQVDELVVDSTYGGPNSRRRYTQSMAETCLVETVSTQLKFGAVHIKAHRGTIERVFVALVGEINAPILASNRLIKEIKVYQRYGLAGGELIDIESVESAEILRAKRYVRFYSKGDHINNDPAVGTSITCSAYMHQKSASPLLKFSDRSFSVALSNHADFDETLEYIKSTGAKTVVTDNTRTHGEELAIAINKTIRGVNAVPSSNNNVTPR